MQRFWFIVVVAVVLAHGGAARASATSVSHEIAQKASGAGLGAAQGTLQELPGNTWKQLYARGAIYWRPSFGPILVRGPIWSRYSALGAETSLLGLPVSDPLERTHQETRNSAADRDHASVQSFVHGDLVWHPVIERVFMVRGSLLEVWRKNDRMSGPLGLPLEDSRFVSGGPGGLWIVGTVQDFEGATIDWSMSRPALGLPAWHAEIDAANAAHVRVSFDYWARRYDPDAFCAVTLDTSFWAHQVGSEEYVETFERTCNLAGRIINVQLDIRFAIRSGSGTAGGKLDVKAVKWDTNGRVPDGVPQYADVIDPDEQEDFNVLFQNTDDHDWTMAPEVLVIYNEQLRVDDIVF